MTDRTRCTYCTLPVNPPDTIHVECIAPSARERRLHRVIAASALRAGMLVVNRNQREGEVFQAFTSSDAWHMADELLNAAPRPKSDDDGL
jgi:hypothetical protein